MQSSHRQSNSWIVLACLGVTLAVSQTAFAQICRPVSERTAELGCWITANAALGQLPQPPIFWHLDTYPTRVDAEAARGPRGIVVESLGKVWLPGVSMLMIYLVMALIVLARPQGLFGRPLR